MKQLCMDSAYKHLILGCYQDDVLVDGIAIEAFKKQSETIFVELNQLLKRVGWDYKDIDQVIITKGPGSYTGIRIAMTVAKVLCTQMDIECYTISTMQLYAGNQTHNVILDARGKRAYVAHVENGQDAKTLILPIDEIQSFLDQHPSPLVGDGYLMEQECPTPNFLENFIQVKRTKVKNIHALVPDYLKESDAYKG